jgi:hypothetical protein
MFVLSLPPCLARVFLCLQEVQSMQFNILVTTYETIMRDRWVLSTAFWLWVNPTQQQSP